MKQYDFNAESGMLIRKPVSEVYEAIINPEITTRFWFTKSSGRLDEHRQVEWAWEMYQVSDTVTVLALEPGKKIKMQWDNRGEAKTVEWTFTPMDENNTFIHVIEYGYKGNTEEILNQVRDSTGGFCWVLAGLKAWLEHGIELNLVGDRFPKGL